jgi:predicted acetyltransferase
MDLRPITVDELPAFTACFTATFGDDDDPSIADRLRSTIVPLRAWAAFDGRAMVATAAAYSLTMGVPGGTMAMAGFAFATVRATHRRRGLLRRLIAAHVDDATARGEPVSGLWASEGTIYGRFGWGIAAYGDELTLDSRRGAIASVGAADPIDWVDEAGRGRLAAIYARAMRPGMLVRDEAWWQSRVFAEHAWVRDGASRLRQVIARRGGEDVGYVLYRQRPAQLSGLPSGTLEIVELVALDAQAEASLWQFLAGVDLFPTVRWENAPTDCALPWLASEPRRVQRRPFDTLWLRLNDVAAALAGRRYAADGALCFESDGATWRLAVSGGEATCARSDAAPELRFANTALASAFLGGVSVATLARAGRVTGAPDAIARAARLFSWPVAPWCPELF